MASDEGPVCPVFGCGLDDVNIGETTDFGTVETDLEEVVLDRGPDTRRTAFCCGSCGSILSVSHYPYRMRWQRRAEVHGPSDAELLDEEMACPACGEYIVPSVSGKYRFSPLTEKPERSQMAFCPECDAILGTNTLGW